MPRSDWRRCRFDAADDEPLAAMSNLLDIMLVFACGLIAALATQRTPVAERGGREIVEGREIPELPAGVDDPGSGYESIGRVYRDPESGKLVLIGRPDRD